jgi:hypothetical protein
MIGPPMIRQGTNCGDIFGGGKSKGQHQAGSDQQKVGAHGGDSLQNGPVFVEFAPSQSAVVLNRVAARRIGDRRSAIQARLND